MAAVKGSKQHQMVVVPYRPLYKVAIFCVFLVFMATFSWLTYEFGMSQGIALKVAVVKERDEIRQQLDEANMEGSTSQRRNGNLHPTDQNHHPVRDLDRLRGPLKIGRIMKRDVECKRRQKD